MKNRYSIRLLVIVFLSAFAMVSATHVRMMTEKE